MSLVGPFKLTSKLRTLCARRSDFLINLATMWCFLYESNYDTAIPSQIRRRRDGSFTSLTVAMPFSPQPTAAAASLLPPGAWPTAPITNTYG
ncbi:unnamed protein product [Trifolium pratense]|uniref:Uncharacterized protein n=1 Tax=Trifolium pratense TaxID=57577 RepID=A0ACB0I7K4_TRIPR|nr:unnamed protein product [Trifolium pratense]